MLAVFGPLPLIWPVLLTSLLSCWLGLYTFRLGRFSDAFPSMSWAVFMQLPFILVSDSFHEETAQAQRAGILLVAIALLTADAITASYGTSRSDMSRKSARLSEEAMTIGLGLLVICLPIYHISEANNLPILKLISSQETVAETVLNREAFGKLLDVPTIAKYAFNWVLTLFSPLLIGLLAYRNRTGLAVAIFCWTSVYATMSTAIQPLLTFIVFTSFVVVAVSSEKAKKVARWGGLALLFGIASVGVIRTIEISGEHSLRSQSTQGRQQLMDIATFNDGIRNVTIADAYRLARSQQETGPIKLLDYLTYRTMLTPVEVSYYWYAYFPEVWGDYRDLGELIGNRSDGITHAANRVGLWAYRERFPEQYAVSNSSYASLDADAFAFGGTAGTVIASFFLFCGRLLGGVFGSRVWKGIPARLVSAQIGLFLISASLQAILVAQGLVMFLLLIAILIISKAALQRN